MGGGGFLQRLGFRGFRGDPGRGIAYVSLAQGGGAGRREGLLKVFCFNGLLERCCERFLEICSLKAVHEISDYNSDDLEEGVVKQHAPGGSEILHDARIGSLVGSFEKRAVLVWGPNEGS